MAQHFFRVVRCNRDTCETSYINKLAIPIVFFSVWEILVATLEIHISSPKQALSAIPVASPPTHGACKPQRLSPVFQERAAPAQRSRQ